VARVQVGSAIMGAVRGKVTAMEREREREREKTGKRVLTPSGNVEITGRREWKYCDIHKVVFTSQL
jgi:hypothetical protein